MFNPQPENKGQMLDYSTCIRNLDAGRDKVEVLRGWERGFWELLLNGYRVSVWDENVLKIDSGSNDFFFFFWVGVEAGYGIQGLCMLGKCSATVPHPQS